MTDQAATTLPATPDLVISSKGNSPPGAVDTAGTVAAARETRKAVGEARQRLEEKIGARSAAPDFAPPPEDPPTMREELASIIIELPDGRQVTMAKINTLNYRIAVLFSTDIAAYAGLADYARALLCIQEIDGRAPPVIENLVQLRAWMEHLGDDICDLIAGAYRTYWPPMLRSELKVLKKTPKTRISDSKS